ncbi:hypothetical protein [Chloroflexus sp. Y-396-1]|uniref:hypothetical protein n=1 Tax=Chloroflexus sp. Y-396-1 TaxID=867845 RepID=UPI0004920CEA|nr:hypothetical protein [Chloroflexus sp. Y-396-1]
MHAELLLIIFILVCCLLPLVTTGLIAFRFVQHINHLREVMVNGIPTTAKVVRKYTRNRRNRIVFEYRDITGRLHRKDRIVFRSEYHRFHPGDSLDVVYSAQRPHIVFFKEVIDQSRAAQQAGEQSNLDSSEQ